jgi:stearoyl-CoA desaturase (Delta-9 desaturase)
MKQSNFSYPLLFMHIACIGIFFTPAGWSAILIFLTTYTLHVFALTAGYHRYFSHKTYKTSRTFQFLMALLGTTAAQRDPLWWASHHRLHHQYADTEEDPHSPIRRGFWWAHLGWVMRRECMETRFDRIKDFAKYPELRWLNRHPYLPAILFALLLYSLGAGLEKAAPQWGASGTQFLFYGFFLSTIAVYHVTFSINSILHMYGKRPYHTADQSRNNWPIALLTMGEGWHNNHHRYALSTRQGFKWWQLDLSYLILRGLQALHIVWEIREPPASILEEGKQTTKPAAIL